MYMYAMQSITLHHFSQFDLLTLDFWLICYFTKKQTNVCVLIPPTER